MGWRFTQWYKVRSSQGRCYILENHKSFCYNLVILGNPEPRECWDGDTAWRMPRRQWRHHTWGCCCIDAEAGWYRKSPPGASGQTLIPQNKWTDSHRTMKNSSIGHTTRGLNFIEDWILEIMNYPTVVELCIPVISNNFTNEILFQYCIGGA